MPVILGGSAIVLAIIIIASIFWIWMLIDCLMNPRINGTEKIVWVLVILFLHILGAIIYFAVGRQK